MTRSVKDGNLEQTTKPQPHQCPTASPTAVADGYCRQLLPMQPGLPGLPGLPALLSPHTARAPTAPPHQSTPHGAAIIYTAHTTAALYRTISPYRHIATKKFSKKFVSFLCIFKKRSYLCNAIERATCSHRKIGVLAHLARARHWQCRGERFESAVLHSPSNSPESSATSVAGDSPFLCIPAPRPLRAVGQV